MTENSELSYLDEEYEENVSLSYDYVEKSLKEIQDISDNINNKLGLLIGFDFTFIRFFISSLPDRDFFFNSLPCNSCLLLKILAYIFSTLSIVICCIGLRRNTEYYIIPPNLLIDECDKSSSTGLKLAIINTWTTKLDNFIKLAEHKKELFNYSIILFMLSGLMFIISEIINFIF
jgi:hypothetical protein